MSSGNGCARRDADLLASRAAGLLAVLAPGKAVLFEELTQIRRTVIMTPPRTITLYEKP